MAESTLAFVATKHREAAMAASIRMTACALALARIESRIQEQAEAKQPSDQLERLYHAMLLEHGMQSELAASHGWLETSHRNQLNIAAANPAGEETSARIASIAARGLRDPASLTPEDIRALAGSALTQAPDRAA